LEGFSAHPEVAMSLLGGFNWLDILILISLVIGLGVGYVQGLLRQTLGLAALYVGAILGAQYYTVVSGFIHYTFPDVPIRFVNAIGFFVILMLVASVMNWLAFDAYRVTKLKLFPLLDHFVGSLVGLITTMIVVSIFFPILTFTTGEGWPLAESIRYLIVDGLQTSRLLFVFTILEPGLLNALGPWLPGGLPSLFNL
jgi:uncharacterized membrane protein required for colicin V production